MSAPAKAPDFMIPAKQLPRAIAFSPRFVDPLSGSILIVTKGRDSTGPAQSPTTVQTPAPAAMARALFPARCCDTVAGLRHKLFCLNRLAGQGFLPLEDAFSPLSVRKVLP